MSPIYFLGAVLLGGALYVLTLLAYQLVVVAILFAIGVLLDPEYRQKQWGKK